MAGLPKDVSLAGPAFLITKRKEGYKGPAFLITKRKEGYKMFGLDIKELFFLAIVIIPLALMLTGIACFTLYTIGLFIKDKFTHMHLRHRKAH
jgi:hypothetical protein